MKDEGLLQELLAAEDEAAALEALNKRDLLKPINEGRWKYVGNMPNNQSVVHNQQSTQAAALVEKFTNAADAILIRRCKAQKIDPRSVEAPQSMAKAVEQFFGDLGDKSRDELRKFARRNHGPLRDRIKWTTFAVVI